MENKYKSLTNRQAEFLLAKDRRLNFLTGSVSSGKTWISLVKFAQFVATSPAGYEFLMCGKTVTSLKRNCLGLMDELCGKYFSYTISRKEGWLFGRRVHMEGANDERSEQKIRGMTLGGAYCDEITLYPSSFTAMLLSRLREAGAKLYATANPDNPSHYIKTEYLDMGRDAPSTGQDFLVNDGNGNQNTARALDLADWHFAIEDNTFLDPEYVRQIKNEYTGVFYDRYILGLWVVAEGLVYPMFDRGAHVVPDEPRPYDKYWISGDYGTMNPCVFSLWGFVPRSGFRESGRPPDQAGEDGLDGLAGGVYHLIDEYYYDGRKAPPRTDAEHYDALKGLAGGRKIARVIIDPSAASFITLIRRKGEFAVREADNSVLDGIRECGTALKHGLVRFNANCVKSIAEFGMYSWDNKAAEDRPVKENDHFMDSMRYFVKTLGIAVPKRTRFEFYT